MLEVIEGHLEPLKQKSLVIDRGTLNDLPRNTTLDMSYLLCDSSAPDPQTGEPSAALQSCHVHGTLPLRVFHREEALHYLQVSSYLLCKNYFIHWLFTSRCLAPLLTQHVYSVDPF